MVDFPQPPCIGRLIGVFLDTSQLGLGCVPLMKNARKFGMDDARDPVHNENLPTRELLGLFQYGDRFL